MQSVNFIPMRRREARKLQARKRGWTLAAVVYGSVLALACLVWRAAWSADARDLGHELSTVRAEVDETNRAIAQLRASLSAARQTLSLNRAVAGQPDWSQLLAIVADERGDDVVLNRVAVDAPPDTGADAAKGAAVTKPLFLRVGGYGRTQGAVSQFVLRLEQTGLFESVSLIKTNREPFLATDAVAFKLDCQLKSANTAPQPAVANGGEP